MTFTNAIKPRPSEATHAASRASRQNRKANTPVGVIFQARLALDPTRRASVLRRLSAMPTNYRQTYIRAVRGKSPTAGLKAFCLECAGWDRAMITLCTDEGCPLWPYRPYQGLRG